MSAIGTLIGRGVTGSRPAAGTPGALYFDTTRSVMQRDNGSTWDDVEGAGGGGGSADWVKLASTSVGIGGAATIDFTSISAAYSHLRIIAQARGDTASVAAQVLVRLNNDSGSNYDYLRWNETANPGTNSASETLGGAAGATSFSAGFIAAASATANYADMIDLLIPNYSGTTFYKAIRSWVSIFESTSVAQSDRNNGWWRSTSAISRVTIIPGAGNFAQGSLFSLYGIT